jgi:cytochrome c-type biogenesis protein CcmH
MTKFSSTTRRDFLARIAGASAAAAVMSRTAGAQQRGQMHDSSIVRRDTTNLFAMDQSAARTVQRPPKPGATAVLTPGQRDDLEHRIRCQCGCTLDVFTCRTTDFSCQVSPAMHRDVMALVEGGYDAQEIIDAFVGTYGERARMAPTKSGFNLLAWFAPGGAVILGGAAILMVLRRWNTEKAELAAAQRSVPSSVAATSDELARLDAAVRGDDQP